MAAAYSITVRCAESERKEHEKKLRKLGLKWDADAYYGCIRYNRYKKVKRYCETNGLKLKMDTGFLSRSGNYRSMFFRYHEPQINGRYYLCSYCGRLLTEDTVTVDHLYPIKKVRETPALQRKLRKMGIHDVNDPANLVASCHKCNAKKAAKTGEWILMGKIGQNVMLWRIRKFLRLCLILICLIVLYRYGYPMATEIMAAFAA